MHPRQRALDTPLQAPSPLFEHAKPTLARCKGGPCARVVEESGDDSCRLGASLALALQNLHDLSAVLLLVFFVRCKSFPVVFLT
jgi:hypothetical protein